MSSQKASSFLQFLLIFALVYLGSQFALQQFFPDQYGPQSSVTGVILEPVDSSVKGGHSPMLTIRNKTESDLLLENRCPLPPVLVWKVLGNGEKALLETQETALPCVPLEEVPAGETVTVDLSPWKYSLFDEYGTYEVELPVPEGTEVGVIDTESQYREGVITRFSLYEAGVFTQIFRTFITKPLLNLLVLIASWLPDYNLGMAIIIVTIIVKLILFLPTQHAMEGQKKMQEMQPKMDALRAKYKDDPKKLQEETMKLWKEHGINPMQSCLPMLIQFPVLIGLFFTVRDGSVLALSQHLLYEPFQHISWSFGMNFFGLDLTQPSIYLMPPLLVVMQFFQMKLSFAIAKKKKVEKGEAQEVSSQQQIQQRVMMYGLPFVIGFFALQFPAAVSLYWGISTLFAIGQQIVVNRRK